MRQPQVADDNNAVDIEHLLPRWKGQGYEPEHVAKRRRWVEERTGADLTHTGSGTVDTRDLRGNIENPIGVSQIPVGIAGPVLVKGRHADGLFYVPMATTEGALLRSYERGMVALSKAGGVQVEVHDDENQISPAFFFPDVDAARKFVEWASDHHDDFARAAGTTTSHGRLTSVRCYPAGRRVFLNLGFDTGDAHGMNMIVKAAHAVCEWIRGQYSVDSFQIFSGMSSEKRASGFVMSRGKGKRVTAGAFLPPNILKGYLHATVDQMLLMWRSTVIGHLYAGSIGFNAHIANGLTAIFIAAGQDVANVANSACGITELEPCDDGLYVSVTLPALTVATVGGGTGLPTQQEALRIMDCVGDGKAKRLAEIVAATLLGGEVSMGAAIASGEFVDAHEQYGRNRPENGPGPE